MRLSILSVLFGVGMVGCSKDPLSIHFQQICFPPVPDSSGICAYSPECASFLADGVVEVDLSATENTTLKMPLQIANLMPSNEDTSAGRVNTNDAQINEFRMSYSGEGISLSAVSKQSLRVPASGTTSTVVWLIPTAAGVELATLLSSTPTDMTIFVQAAGKLDSGKEFVTDAFQVPVKAQNGGWGARDASL